MGNIQFSGGDNLGGVEFLYWVDVNDVDWIQWPEIEDNIVKRNVVLLENKTWSKITFIQETVDYSEDEDINKYGIFYKARVSGSLAKDSPDLSLELQKMRDRHLIICYKDNNGYYKLCGNKTNYLKASKTLNTENQFSGRNGYKLKFEGQLLQESAFYFGDFTGLPDELTGIFDDTFDLTFE